MPRPIPHRLTLLLALAAAGVVAATAFVFRDHLVEEWYMWRLESDDPKVRTDAAEALADRKCLRAAPRLVRRIQEIDDERGSELLQCPNCWKWNCHGRRQGQADLAPGVRVLSAFTPLVLALYRLGPEVEDYLPEAPADPRVGETARSVRRAWAEEEPRIIILPASPGQ